MVCWVYSLELPQWGNSNEYTRHTFLVKISKFPLNIPKSLSWATERIFYGLKNQLESAMINEAMLSKSLKFYYTKYMAFLEVIV